MPRTVNRTMSALLPVVTARPNHLKCCKLAGLTGDQWIKCVEDTRTNILNTISTYPRTIPVESSSALINCICEDPELFSSEDQMAIVESINSKTWQNDMIDHSTEPRLLRATRECSTTSQAVDVLRRELLYAEDLAETT